MSTEAVGAGSLNQPRFVLRSLWFYRRSNVAIALGVATAATVIIGALLVGDSMRGSLRALTDGAAWANRRSSHSRKLFSD